VSDFDASKVECNQELVMPDHTSKLFVVRPSTETGDRFNGINIEEDEEEPSSGS
jgi:hypothetical protein